MNIKTKVKGFMSFNAVLLCLVALMAGYSLLQIYGSQFSALSASRKALQAQQFAQSEADLLRNTSYDELDAAAHDRQVITGVNGWMSEISLEAETTINEVPQRLATVKIYRNSTVTVPDFSLKVPLSSAYGGSDGIPIGTIVMRTSDFLKTSESSKYLLCNGSEVPSSYPKLRMLMTHTPDLRDRVPQGTGVYAVNTQIESGLPNIKGGWVVNWYSAALMSGPFYVYQTTSNKLHANISGGTYEYQHDTYFDASRCSSVYKDDCTTVQPPALAVAFYIKAK